ncbi:MAG: branched-chain amino acid ABC transporter permease [Methylocystaceae bacterium]
MLTKREKIFTLIGLVTLFAVLALLNYLLDDYYLRIINLIGINIILVASLNLTNGFTGIFSLGHAGFMAVGAYVSALLTIPEVQKAAALPDLPPWLMGISLPFPVALLAAGLIAALFALVIGFPVLRLRGHYLAVATLGFLVIVRVGLANAEAITRGARGISGLPAFTNTWWVWGVAVLTIYLLWRLLHSSYGRGMIAIRDNEVAAAALGVNVTAHKMLAFATGAFFAGVGGALWGHLFTVISPNFFSYNQTFLLVEMSVIGGMASLTGAVTGATLMTVLPEVLRLLEGGAVVFGYTLPPLYGLSQLILASLVIVVIIFRPQGLIGRWEFSWKRILNSEKKGEVVVATTDSSGRD